MYVPQILLFVAVFTCLDHIYVGCYATNDISLSFALSYSSGITSLRDCVSACGGYFYVGLTSGSVCYCLRAQPFFIGSSTTIQPNAMCMDTPCSSDTNLCGSVSSVSVFRMGGGRFSSLLSSLCARSDAVATVNQYTNMGCYIDRGIPVLLGTDKGAVNTIGQCAGLCPYPYWKYFGVGDKEGAGIRCYCTGRLSSVPLVAPQNGCIYGCLGNGSENCGGDSALQTFQWKSMPVSA
jgi:hypothetical protein